MNALDGIRILDLSRVLAGPWCTQTLADLGADVVKVERPPGPSHPGGDDTRGWGPPFLKGRDGTDTAEAAYYLGANRNKRSITCDIAQPEGQALIRELAAQADVFVENYKVGDMARYGLDFASLHAINPKLVYCSITGFGQTGPYKDRAGYDYAIQGMGGLMSVTGERDDLPGGGPQKVGVAVADLFTGLYATVAIQAALRHAERTGEGQHIDMALLDVGMAVLANQAAGFLATGESPGRAGNIHPSLAPYQDFATANGNVLLAIGNDGQFARFCAAVGEAGWAQDERFATNTARVRNRQALLERMVPLMKTRGTAEWIALLEDKAVPCGPINTIAQAFDDPQVRARGIRVELPREAGDGISRIAGVASPMRLSDTPPVLRSAPPSLGQHTDEVLGELGIAPMTIQALRSRGVV